MRGMFRLAKGGKVEARNYAGPVSTGAKTEDRKIREVIK
jgi:hypothetical protein